MNESLAQKIRQLLNGGKGYDHLSPSSLAIPIQKFFINYLMFDQEERRKQLSNFKAHFGNACNNPAQRFLCKYIFELGNKTTVKKSELDPLITDELFNISLIPAKNDRDELCRKEMKQYIKPTTLQIVKAIKEIFKDQELMAERYVHDTPQGLILDILGRIDYESEDKIVELKTKPINFRQGKKGLSTYIQKLPEEPEEAHLKQLAFYFHATKKKPYLVYVNPEEYKIFEPHPEELQYYYNQMIDKAFTIQNLLEITQADINKLTQLIEKPDLKNFYYADLTEKQIEQVKKVWRM